MERYLPIWIGPCEAEAISVGVNKIQMERPLTHDLILNTMGALSAELLYIFINDLADNTFYARLILDVQGEEIEVDSRPSDAMAIAVRVGVPIYVAEYVMDEAGVVPEEDIAEGEDAEKNLGVFRDFLSSLDSDTPPSRE
jgi:bifunctional DNase/RNase